ncbi:MAG: MBL fold metallo-hydrolase [Proteobacteria bacterium]|nr:MBL fold metallo-hydrolase [Pseudomonadota bacterium]
MLGTGTPIPDPDRSGPATAVVAGNKAYLVDFGPGVVRRASAAFLKGIAQLNTRLLSRAFVTHLHSDHTAGFSDLILSPAVIGRPVPLEVYGPPGIKAMTKHILDAYREDLEVRRIKHTQRGIRGYQVHAHEISAGAIYKDKNVKVTAFPVRHGFWKHAFGYRFDTENRSIVISGDTGPAETTIAACNGCDVLVHEVYCLRGFENGSSSWQEYHATHHTSSKELAELASRARPGLLVLYHQLFFGCAERQIMDEIRSRYKGEVVFGNDLDVY